MNKKTILTLLKSNESYDFSNVVGHKNELNEAIGKRIQEKDIEIEKGRKKFIDDKTLISDNNILFDNKQKILIRK